jgi:hypothetical protein
VNARNIAALLAAAACVFIFAAVGPESWPLVLIWLGVCLLVGWLWHALPALRLALAVALLPLCVLFTWEGGLFFLPSAVALLVASVPRRYTATS